MLQAAIDHSQQYVTGPRAAETLQGQTSSSIGRESKYSLYDQDLVTFEEGRGSLRSPRCCGLHQAQTPLRLRTPRPAQEEARAL